MEKMDERPTSELSKEEEGCRPIKLLRYPSETTMAPEVNLLHQGQHILKDEPIDPLAKFERVLKVVSGQTNKNCPNKSQLSVKKVSNTVHPI